MLDDDKNNKTNQHFIKENITNIIDKIILDKSYEEGKEKIMEFFKTNLTNSKLINLSLSIINKIIINKNIYHHKILSIIPEICKLNSKIFSNNIGNIDTIISIFQKFLIEENSPFFSQISQYFGDTIKVLLNPDDYDSKKLFFLIYNKFRAFCISNMKADEYINQICGTLCLTAFIENCDFNCSNNSNLKYIFEILCELIKKEGFPGKLEILNCFISLIFCSEEKYLPYAQNTIDEVIIFINSREWLIRKFSLNIIYTMLFYFKNEIMKKKDYILEKFKVLKNEQNEEIKDMIEQIYKLLNNEEDYNSLNLIKNVYSSDSLIDSNKYKNDIYKSNEKFNLCDDEDKIEENLKTSREPERVMNKYKNNFIQVEKKISKSKSNYKRNINNSKINKLKYNSKLNDKSIKKKKIITNEIIKKIKNKNKTENSRNSMDIYFSNTKKDLISLIMKKKELSLEKKKNKNYKINSSEKHKKVINIINKENTMNTQIYDNFNNNKKGPSHSKKKSFRGRNDNNNLKEYKSSTKKTSHNNSNTNMFLSLSKEHKIVLIDNKNKNNNKRHNNSFEIKENRNHILMNKSIENNRFNLTRNKNNLSLEKNKKHEENLKNKSISINNKYKKDKKENNNIKITKKIVNNNSIKNKKNYFNNMNSNKINSYKYSQFENKFIKAIKPNLKRIPNNSKTKLIPNIIKKDKKSKNKNNNEKERLDINCNKSIYDISSQNNNNITINNNVISISEENNLNNNNQSSTSIENKFKKYKNETNKIIDDLKSQVNSLKISLYNFEENAKQKEKLNMTIKSRNFEQAFEIAINIGNIQEVYYVIKHYQLYKGQNMINIKNDILADIMRILCNDILMCENLRLIINFILENIIDKEIIFEEDLKKVIYDAFKELYNKRKELCFLKKDVLNILKIVEYFNN